MVFWGLPHYWGYNGDIQVDSGYDTGINDIYILTILKQMSYWKDMKISYMF